MKTSSIASQSVPAPQIPQVKSLPAVQPVVPIAKSATVQPNPAAFRSAPTTSSSAALRLPAPEEMNAQIEQTPVQHMQTQHQRVRGFLQRQNSSLDLFKDMIDQGLQHKDLDLLPDVAVDQKSEYSRSLDDDTREVLQGLKNLSPEDLQAKKAAAYQHPEVLRDKPKAIAEGYYGSKQHKQYGALVSKLTAGIISAEEAMAMNPSGGLPGPGMNEVPLLGRFDSVARHAMRHDATGFLLTRFGVGPGYGTPTTLLGMDKDNPLAGQWLGILREVGTASVLPDIAGVGAPKEWA